MANGEAMTDVEVTETLCLYLGQLDGWTYEGVYEATDGRVAMFYGAIGPEPDRAVGVRIYGAEDDAPYGYHSRRVQFRFRGARWDPTGADQLASEAFPALTRLSRWGGLLGATRLSMAPLGADANGREERSDNYIVTIDNPEA